jgi:hypothetical protein
MSDDPFCQFDITDFSEEEIIRGFQSFILEHLQTAIEEMMRDPHEDNMNYALVVKCVYLINSLIFGGEKKKSFLEKKPHFSDSYVVGAII